MIDPPRRRFLTGSGETPAYDDDSPDAVAYRARLGEQAHGAVLQLKSSVDGINTRWDAAVTRWDDWKSGAKSGVWWALRIVGGLALAGAAYEGWHQLVTLHH